MIAPGPVQYLAPVTDCIYIDPDRAADEP